MGKSRRRVKGITANAFVEIKNPSPGEKGY
jgi:hypothetical protein